MLKMRQPNELVELCKHLPSNCTMVEIGCYNGESTEQFISSGKIKTIYCIDPYLNGYDDGDVASSSRMDIAKSYFIEMTNRNKDKCNIIFLNMLSKEAITEIKEKIDFVYIDGNHTYEGIKQDIITYYPLVKTGMIGGHDYNHPLHPGVKKAVDEILGIPKHTFSDRSWIFN